MNAQDRSRLLHEIGLEAVDLTEQEIAVLEGVSVRTVQSWRQTGTGPRYRKLGKGRMAPVRYPVEWYQQWRERTAITCTAQRPGRTSSR